MNRRALLRTCSLVALAALSGCAAHDERPSQMGRHVSIKDDPADAAPRRSGPALPTARPVVKTSHVVPSQPSSPPARPAVEPKPEPKVELPAPRLPKDVDVTPPVRIVIEAPIEPKVVTPEPKVEPKPLRAPVVEKPSAVPSVAEARPSSEIRRKAPDVTPPQPPKMAAVPPTVATPVTPTPPVAPPAVAPTTPPPVASVAPPQVAKPTPPAVSPPVAAPVAPPAPPVAAPPVAQPAPVAPPVVAAPAPAIKIEPKPDAKTEPKIAALTDEQRTAATLLRADQYMKAGQYQNARTYLEDAAKGGNGKIIAALAEIYDPLLLREQYPRLSRTGDPERAIALYEQAKAKGVAGLDARIAALKTLAGPKR